VKRDMGDWARALLTIAAFAVGAGVAVGILSTLVLLGLWPFLKLGQWLLG
jgi:hypothetical protein